MKRFEDYKKEVILTYEKKKAEGILPHNLQYPTTAKLKSECLNIFHNRYTEKDSEIFKMLFNERNSKDEYYKALENINSDRFKALYKLLRGNTQNPSDKYIELLAWLIDFQPRPHKPITGYEIGELEKPLPEEKTTPTTTTTSDNPQNDNPINTPTGNENAPTDDPSTDDNDSGDNSTIDPPIDDPEDGPGFPGIPTKLYKTIAVCLLAFLTLSGSYFIYEMKKPKCMYWDGDQYRYISCEERKDYGTIILPVDSFKYAHLKRIKKRSEIRRSDIGKVHYSKINNEVEFYTVNSENPTDTTRKLLPMSAYIYYKYVSPRKK
ncbi:hypothetical protein [Pedobacter gandavensis]|uniref:Uncharacterized protein n=1 Tax=Pedobacter gandavensis TaxID=2679963 RepID=A0ABR6EQR7_9SPHI|nr:hypothetical protein [Pedobacter gandavensis]MBB2147591.1 hypothetical protein [Pedobacter gandavensis]